ncbi:MAG: PAS domain S-box protein, partial [Coleofasciculus sp. S288]|nr:PAS domain S-box protein [Coleofasciculus sp. S288]
QCCQARQWQSFEIDLLQQLAFQVAIAIQQADLYQQVQRELSRSKQAEEALRQAYDDLEIRVQERTAQLTQSNASLQAEILERQQVEEALRVNEERFRTALKNSPIVVFNQDTDLRYTWIYHPAPDFNPEEVLGKLETELNSPENAQQLTAIKGQVLTTRVGMRRETALTFDGEVRYCDLTVEPLQNPDGEIIGITCAATDVTDIRIREIQLRAIFEGALDAIAITNDEGTYVETNPAACQLFGLPLAELLGKRIADFMEPNCVLEPTWHPFREQGQRTGEVSLLRPDGTVRIVEFAATANFLPGRHLAVLRDITERKQAEEALRASQRFIQQIADTTPTMIYIYELFQTRNVYANRQVEEFFGCRQAQIQAKGFQFFADVSHPDDLGKLAALQEKFTLAKDGEVIEDEFRMKNAKGEWRWLHNWEVVFTRNHEGIPQQILGTAADVTELKQAEEIRSCLEAEKELRRLQLRFFSMVSHEFRTPLSTILGSAQLLKAIAKDDSEEKRLRNIQRIEMASKHMTQLLDTLLTINRAESGKLEVNPQPIDLEKFCRRLVEEQ